MDYVGLFQGLESLQQWQLEQAKETSSGDATVK